MSKFNSFARELDSIVREYFQELQAAEKAVDSARQAVKNHPDVSPRSSVTAETAKKMADSAAAKARLLEAESDLRRTKWKTESYLQKINDVREELQEAVSEEFSVKPELVDESTIALLKSGIMKPDEYSRLMEKAVADENHTMTRLISDFAKKEADALRKKITPDSEEYKNVVSLVMTSRRASDGSEYLNDYDALSEVAQRCFNNTAMIPKWEELTADFIEEF